MPKLKIAQVKDRGRKILAQSKTGIRWSQLIKKIASESPATPYGTITGGLRALLKNEREGIKKISKGVYILKENEGNSTEVGPAQKTSISTPKGETIINEEAFYGPFAEWLKAEGEATEAEALGGAIRAVQFSDL